MNGSRFIKVVIVGPSGVGKTSLRHQYISGRFTTGYRATIGTDFITKTLPYHSKPQLEQASRSATTSEPSEAADDDAPPPPLTPSAPDSITLQIWDTAGQERFSSLSTAFFRGADAVILVFDVNKPGSLQELSRWWNEFRLKVPIQEGHEAEYCTVVVGNKTDLIQGSRKAGKEVLSTREVAAFLRDMIPVEGAESVSEANSSQIGPPATIDLGSEQPQLSAPGTHGQSSSLSSSRPTALPAPTKSLSFSTTSPVDNQSRSKSITPRFSQLKDHAKFGTVNTMRTEISVYHTPSSSLFHSRSSSASPTETALAGRAASKSREQSSDGTSSPQNARPAGSKDSQEFDMELEFDYDHDIDTSFATSSGGYVTARSQLTESSAGPSRMGRRSNDPRTRPRVGSVLSDSSLATVKPLSAAQSRADLLFSNPSTQSFAAGGLPLSPPRSRASTTSSSSTRSARARSPNQIDSTGLPTPSASPPSPPTLTASLIATMHQAQAQELRAAKLTSAKKLDVGPKLFFTSAKTGGIGSALDASGVDLEVTPVTAIFDYLAERVVKRWEWEEQTGDAQEAEEGEVSAGVGAGKRKRGALTIKLTETWNGLVSGGGHVLREGCCAT